MLRIIPYLNKEVVILATSLFLCQEKKTKEFKVKGVLENIDQSFFYLSLRYDNELLILTTVN